MDSQPLNVLYIIDSLSAGGAERQFTELVKGICSTYQKSVRPHLCYFNSAQNGFEGELKKLHIPVCAINRKTKYDLSLFLKLNRYVSQNKIDLIHSFSVLAGSVATLFGKARSIPVVASTIRNAKDYNAAMKYSILMQSYLADVFISNSKSGFENRFKKKRDNFKIVYNGVDSERFLLQKNESSDIKKKYGLSSFEYTVSMVASLSANKDHNTFIDAVPHIIKKYPGCGFLIVGDGPEKETLIKKVRRLNINTNIRFTGFSDNIPAILDNTTISVLMTNTRKVTEGISNSLLESMIMGVPVIASYGGGTNEVITDSVNGFLVTPRDPDDLSEKICQLLSNAELRQQLSDNGRKLVLKTFGYKRYIDEYYSIYATLMKHKKFQ